MPQPDPRSADTTRLSQTEINALIGALYRTPDLLRLRRIARKMLRARGLDDDPDDLIQEAASRALGMRLGPARRADFVGVFVILMRRSATVWRKRRKRAKEGTNEIARRSINSSAVSAEELIVAEDTYCEKLALFKDDPIAARIIEEKRQGSKGEELRRQSGLTKADFASKCRKIRNRLKAYLRKTEKYDRAPKN